jgi:hypothetical protein
LAAVSITVIGHGWSFAANPTDDSAGWRAGVARRCITPPELMWMSGYASRNRPAEGTLTDLWAKALVLEDPAGRRHVLVTLDLVGIDRETLLGITDAITAEHGLPREAIALATSRARSQRHDPASART